MEMRLHQNSALSDTLSVTHRSPKCLSSRPSKPSAVGLDVLSVSVEQHQEKNSLGTGKNSVAYRSCTASHVQVCFFHVIILPHFLCFYLYGCSNSV